MIPARWRLRWQWRRLKCALGFHAWCHGPFTINGRWKREDGEIVEMPTAFTPYFCAFGYPWCNATKREPKP